MDKRLHGDPDRIMEHAEAGYCLSHSEELHLCKYTRSLRSALAVAQARVTECSDREALLSDNVGLRADLAEKTAQVERLREAFTKIEQETWLDPKISRVIIRDLSREALAETATAPDNFARFETRTPAQPT